MIPRPDMPDGLEASRADFAYAVGIVAGVMGKRTSGASLRFEDGWLFIEAGRAIARAPARGTWPLTIVVGASWVRRPAKSVPAGDPVCLRVDEGRLQVNGYSEPCAIAAVDRPISPKPPQLDEILEAARILKPLRIKRVGYRNAGRASWRERACFVVRGRQGNARDYCEGVGAARAAGRGNCRHPPTGEQRCTERVEVNRTDMKKKLIEVALPLEAINKESAREKSIRHGHPSTLHLWWARRPLAACRAVLFASLVDDPSSLPEQFPTEGYRSR